MNRAPAFAGTAIVMSVLIIATVLTAFLYVPPRMAPSHSVITVKASTSSQATTLTTATTSSSINQTTLTVMMLFPNGTALSSGTLLAGTLAANETNGQYLFQKISPGVYPLSLKGTKNIYLPTTSLQLSSGLNYANITVYALNTFLLMFDNGLDINGTQPGPPITVPNATAVELTIINNTTLIHNLAVVATPGNDSASNILFNSQSSTLSAGGSTNSTFVVTMIGAFYYEDLIGNHAQFGVYGNFTVITASP